MNAGRDNICKDRTDEKVSRTTGNLVLLEAGQIPISCMLDCCKVYCSKFADIDFDVAFKPNLTHVRANNLSAHL